MKARFRYRIYPTPGQRQALARTFGCARVVWNDALRIREEARKAGEPFIPDGELEKRVITQAKKTPERAWLAEVSNVALQQSFRNLSQAYKNFFNSLKGKRKGKKVGAPRFKRRRSAQSIHLTRYGFALHGEKLYLAKIGDVEVRWSRDLPSVPSSVTIMLDSAGRYFASFVCEIEPTPLPPNDNSISIDLGLTTFATLNTGKKIEPPKYHKKALKRLRRLQRNLSRKQKGSKRREVARRKLARLHARIADRRTDFLHKESTKLIRENQTIALEDLNVSGMVRNRCLARAISDAGWRQFRTLLEAKGKRYGRDVRVIDRWEPTSQRCSTCGSRCGRKSLDVREWECLHCGAHHDRDINAALNIKVAGERLATKNKRGGEGQTPSQAIGDGVSSAREAEQLLLPFAGEQIDTTQKTSRAGSVETKNGRGGRRKTRSRAAADEASTHREVKQLRLLG